jgi:hypothetical protein
MLMDHRDKEAKSKKYKIYRQERRRRWGRFNPQGPKSQNKPVEVGMGSKREGNKDASTCWARWGLTPRICMCVLPEVQKQRLKEGGRKAEGICPQLFYP